MATIETCDWCGKPTGWPNNTKENNAHGEIKMSVDEYGPDNHIKLGFRDDLCLSCCKFIREIRNNKRSKWYKD